MILPSVPTAHSRPPARARPLKSSVSPTARADHESPPLTVRRILPLSPAIHPTKEFCITIWFKFVDTPALTLDHTIPPSVVLNVSPPVPAMIPIEGLTNVTAR